MPDDRRGLDHLMEQNETELGFLAAYGGVDDQDHPTVMPYLPHWNAF